MFPVCTIDPTDPMNPMNPIDPIDPIIYAQNNPRNQTPKQPPSGGCFGETTPAGGCFAKTTPLKLKSALWEKQTKT